MKNMICTMTIAAMALAAGAANAGQIYATNTLANNADNADDLIVFDSSNPAGYSVIGSLGVSGISFGGLDFDSSGNLFGYASLYRNTGGAASGLYSIDTNTGAATLIGDSGQTMQDLAYNPVDNKMYGINTRFGQQSTLFTVDMQTGDVTDLGLMQGLPEQHHLGGLSITSTGQFIVHDVVTDSFYSGSTMTFSHLLDLTQDTGYSQGMTIDWSRGDIGYHGAVGQADFPNYFSTLNTFNPDGSSYSIGDAFGPNDIDGVPPVQVGDLAIRPVPAPAGFFLLLGGAAASTRRRR